MNSQHDKIEQLFKLARSAEPNLSDSVFTTAVMQRVKLADLAASKTSRIETIILWLSGLLGVLLAVSFFPVNDFLLWLQFFEDGITVSKAVFVFLIMSAVAYCAYWVAETDGI